MERELICICCPKGCHLKVNIDELFYSEESKYFKINKNISYEIILNRET